MGLKLEIMRFRKTLQTVIYLPPQAISNFHIIIVHKLKKEREKTVEKINAIRETLESEDLDLTKSTS